MSDSDAHETSNLRAELARAAQMADVVERTFEVVALIEAAAAPLGIHPVLVGGMAVYFWTESEAFLTYDIDVVMEVPTELATKLAEIGFVRAQDRRHWEIPGTDVFLEAPSARLDAGVVVITVVLPSGRTARVLSRVDVLIDRLAEFQATGHQVVGQQVLMLVHDVSAEELETLNTRAVSQRVGTILKAMRNLANELAAGRKPPASDELHNIARTALQAEYSSRKP